MLSGQLGMGSRVSTYALRIAGNREEGVHLYSQDSWGMGRRGRRKEGIYLRIWD